MNNLLKVGHAVIAMGNPYGLENTMTTGIVSALGRSFRSAPSVRIATRCLMSSRPTRPLNPGQLRRPLFDLNGNVVGVNFAIESSSGANSGVGFAIPGIDCQACGAPELIKDGQYDYAYLGLSGSTITAGSGPGVEPA